MAMVRQIERAGRQCFLALILVVMVSTVGTAQTVLDPHLLEFTASPDHFAIDSTGLPLVDRYELSVYDVSTSTRVNLVNLGKPQPGSDGAIRIDLVSVLPTWPLPGGVTYEATVSVVGSSGAASSLVLERVLVQRIL